LKSAYLDSETFDSDPKEDSLWKNSTFSLYWCILFINYDENKSNKINKHNPSIIRLSIVSF